MTDPTGTPSPAMGLKLTFSGVGTVTPPAEPVPAVPDVPDVPDVPTTTAAPVE